VTTQRTAGSPAITVEEFMAAIERLAADQPYPRRTGWVGTTKDQWLGWLSEYNTPGAYNRKGTERDAKFAYTHVQNHQMLIWLLGAAGLETPTLLRAAAEAEQVKTMARKAAAVRKIVPWERALELLWPGSA
jgi:hypothetical protein